MAVAGYEEIPREAVPQELGKAVLMPGFREFSEGELPEKQRVAKVAGLLAETWTEMRNHDEAVEAVAEKLCGGQIRTGSRADFVVWNPELVVIGSKPVRYGQLRQLIEGGRCLYKDGEYLSG